MRATFFTILLLIATSVLAGPSSYLFRKGVEPLDQKITIPRSTSSTVSLAKMGKMDSPTAISQKSISPKINFRKPTSPSKTL